MAVHLARALTGCQLLSRVRKPAVFVAGFLVLSCVLYPSALMRPEYKRSVATGSSHKPTLPTNLSKTSWQMHRKISLQKSNPVKLFLFAYMRGGSSIAGELFNADPSATMWYEPGDAFFSAYYGLFHANLPQHDLYFKNMTRRKLGPDELEEMLKFYNNIFSCNYDDLPPEAMATNFLKESTAMDEYVKCLKGKRKKILNTDQCKQSIRNVCSGNLVEKSIDAGCPVAIAAVDRLVKRYPDTVNDKDLLNFLFVFSGSDRIFHFVRHGRCIESVRREIAKCVHIAIRKCKRDRLRVVQVNRMKMEDLEPVIKANPDLHVVHYTRDPRAVAFSRYKMGGFLFDKANPSTVGEAEFVCRKMREDTRQRKILEKKYPGVFTHLTYESLAVDPRAFASKIYGLFHMNYPQQWRAFVAKHMHAPRDGGAFGITVKNATKAAFSWRDEIPAEQLKNISRICADVIRSLGYEL